MHSVKWLEGDNLELYSAHIISQNDPIATNAERIQSILDVKYAPASTSKMVSECTNLTESGQDKLGTLLNKYADLFDGTLGTGKISPVQLELKPDAKPYHGMNLFDALVLSSINMAARFKYRMCWVGSQKVTP
jgi:hypothetical protein